MRGRHLPSYLALLALLCAASLLVVACGAKKKSASSSASDVSFPPPTNIVTNWPGYDYDARWQPVAP